MIAVRRARVWISKLLCSNNTAVPEPSNLLGIGLAIWLGAKLKQKLGKISHKMRTFE
jgi:hypothetical protein